MDQDLFYLSLSGILRNSLCFSSKFFLTVELGKAQVFIGLRLLLSSHVSPLSHHNEPLENVLDVIKLHHGIWTAAFGSQRDQFRNVVSEYIDYYNRLRPYQGIGEIL